MGRKRRRRRGCKNGKRGNEKGGWREWRGVIRGEGIGGSEGEAEVVADLACEFVQRV